MMAFNLYMLSPSQKPQALHLMASKFNFDVVSIIKTKSSTTKASTSYRFELMIGDEMIVSIYVCACVGNDDLRASGFFMLNLRHDGIFDPHKPFHIVK